MVGSVIAKTLKPAGGGGLHKSQYYGATRQNRTDDLLITNQPLYQLS